MRDISRSDAPPLLSPHQQCLSTEGKNISALTTLFPFQLAVSGEVGPGKHVAMFCGKEHE